MFAGFIETVDRYRRFLPPLRRRVADGSRKNGERRPTPFAVVVGTGNEGGRGARTSALRFTTEAAPSRKLKHPRVVASRRRAQFRKTKKAREKRYTIYTCMRVCVGALGISKIAKSPRRLANTRAPLRFRSPRKTFNCQSLAGNVGNYYTRAPRRLLSPDSARNIHLFGEDTATSDGRPIMSVRF